MGVKCCLKSQLTLLHGLTGLAAGFFCLYTIFSWSTSPTCFPKLVERSGGSIPFQNGLPFLCETLVYGMGVVSLFNFIMCVVNSCLFKSSCIAFTNMMLTTVYLAFSVMGGSLVTVYYIVWCDVLQQAVGGSDGCDAAAVKFDTYNSTAFMSSHKSRMEVQMATIWTMFPLTCFALLTYSMSLLIFAKPEVDDGQFRYILVRDETTPLLAPGNINASLRRSSVSDQGQQSSQSEPNNESST